MISTCTGVEHLALGLWRDILAQTPIVPFDRVERFFTAECMYLFSCCSDYVFGYAFDIGSSALRRYGHTIKHCTPLNGQARHKTDRLVEHYCLPFWRIPPWPHRQLRDSHANVRTRRPVVWVPGCSKVCPVASHCSAESTFRWGDQFKSVVENVRNLKRA